MSKAATAIDVDKAWNDANAEQRKKWLKAVGLGPYFVGHTLTQLGIGFSKKLAKAIQVERTAAK